VLQAFYPSSTTEPRGIAVDQGGDLVVPSFGASTWELLDEATGASIALPGPQLAGTQPYTYSDFTGSLAAIANTQQGIWRVVTNAGFAGAVWNLIEWNQTSVPPNTKVLVDARSASTQRGPVRSASRTVHRDPRAVASSAHLWRPVLDSRSLRPERCRNL
jgi:hypothetical protein